MTNSSMTNSSMTDSPKPDSPKPDSYEPIACAFYDELGIRMLRGQVCTLVLDYGGGATKEVSARIADIYTEGEEEFARLEIASPERPPDEKTSTRVRLDRITRVDDIDRPGVC